LTLLGPNTRLTQTESIRSEIEEMEEENVMSDAMSYSRVTHSLASDGQQKIFDNINRKEKE